MKNILLSSFVVICLLTTNAFSVSLQSLVDAQETIVISPVEINGKKFHPEFASRICLSLGYSRVADSKKEACGEFEATVNHWSNQIDIALDLNSPLLYENGCYGDFKLTEITCARTAFNKK